MTFRAARSGHGGAGLARRAAQVGHQQHVLERQQRWMDLGLALEDIQRRARNPPFLQRHGQRAASSTTGPRAVFTR